MAAAEQQRTAAQRTAALEHLVNEQLKSDLQQVLERRDALYELIAHCLELRNNMTMLLDEQLHSLKTKVPLRLHSLTTVHSMATRTPRRRKAVDA